ncbi:hypothetical protein KI387_000853, partial [Taxus chinensis]
ISPTCLSTRTADIHTSDRTQKECEEGEVTPNLEEEDPDSGFTKVISKKKKRMKGFELIPESLYSDKKKKDNWDTSTSRTTRSSAKRIVDFGGSTKRGRPSKKALRSKRTERDIADGVQR